MKNSDADSEEIILGEEEIKEPRLLSDKDAQLIAKMIEGGGKKGEVTFSYANLAVIPMVSVAVAGVMATPEVAESTEIRGNTVEEIIASTNVVEREYQTRIHHIKKPKFFINKLRWTFDEYKSKTKFPVPEKKTYTKRDLKNAMRAFFDEVRRSVKEEWKLENAEMKSRTCDYIFWQVFKKAINLPTQKLQVAKK
jgi:hypothetical protein